MIGGDGAFDRFMAEASPRARIEAAAKLPVDTVVAKWRDTILDSRVPARPPSIWKLAFPRSHGLLCAARWRAAELAMALNDVHRFVLVAIACALIWVGVIFRPVGTQITPARKASPPPNAASIAEGQLARANDRWRILELRDSIAKLAPKNAGDAATILIDQSLPKEIRQRLSAALSSQWKVLVPQSELPVAIAVVIDSVKEPHGHIRSRQFAGSTPIEVFFSHQPKPVARAFHWRISRGWGRATSVGL